VQLRIGFEPRDVWVGVYWKTGYARYTECGQRLSVDTSAGADARLPGRPGVGASP